MNLLRTNLFLSLYVSLKQLRCPGNGSRKKKQTKKKTAEKPSRQGSVCQKHLDNCGHVEHRISIPVFHEFIKVLLLDNTKRNISTDVLYIPQNARYLFVSIYLFIYLVCGF